MNNQGPDGKQQPNGRGSKTAADNGKPVVRKNKEKVTQGEEEPVEVVMVKEVAGESTRVSGGPKAGPSDSSTAVGHSAAEGPAAKSSGAARGNICHPLEKHQIKWLSGQLQALLGANQDFQQKLKQRLVSEFSRVENPFKFIVALFNEGVLCDGSSDLEANIGFKEMLVQLAVTIGCSEGADGTGGLVKALESSGNLQLLSALWTWAKEELEIEADFDGGLSEAEGITSSLQSPPRSDVASPTEFRSSGAKLMDKIMSHMLEDGFMEQLEAYLVSKASQIVHASEFFTSLLRQNVLDETDVQPANGPQVQMKKQIEMAINAACSKRAIGSLVLALQSSGNELILLETSAWLETLQRRTYNQSIAVANEEGNDSLDDDHGEPADSLKSETRSAGELVASNAVALREILEHFSHSELLRLSLVTKLWKEAARSLMLKRGNIAARLSCNEDHPTCIDLEGFAAVLKTMETAPFSIIQININRRKCCRTTAQDPHGSIDAILAKLAVKKASVKLGRFLNDDRYGNKDCVGVLLAKKLLEDFGGSLQELTLHGFPENCTAGLHLVEQMAENWSFPSLKILNLRDFFGRALPDRYHNYLRALLSRAPNLVTLDTKGGSLKFNETILGSNSTVQWLVQNEVDRPWQEIPENLIANIRLVHLRLYAFLDSTFDFDDFNGKMPRILQACCATTLQAVQLEAKFAVPFMAYGVRFENVRQLDIVFAFENLRRYQPAVLAIVKNFDFTSIFPTLTAVNVWNRHQNDFEPVPDSFQRFLQLAHFKEVRPNRADNIKEIQLYDPIGLTYSSAHFYSQMFPCVQKLELSDSHRESDCHLIGQNWRGLKELTFRFYGGRNLDSIICGLDRKEVAVLGTKTEDYLKTVEIVPVKSGITCMKNLQTLTLVEISEPSGTALAMTKVSGLIAFSRCPNLKVIFRGSSRTCQALNNMAPYVYFE